MNRRQRRAKTDRIDAHKLVTMLGRYRSGERGVWSVVRVPGDADEDARHLHRGLGTLKKERTRQANRIKGLLMSQGLRIEQIGGDGFCTGWTRSRSGTESRSGRGSRSGCGWRTRAGW